MLPEGFSKIPFLFPEVGPLNFSTFAVFGTVSSAPGTGKALPKTGDLQLYLALGAVLLAFGGLYILLRRKMQSES